MHRDKNAARILKTYIATKQNDRLVVTTSEPDRENDRVYPLGVRYDNFLRNPVLTWAHNYTEPWAVIGRIVGIDVDSERITVIPEFRPPFADYDPQHVIRSLWENNFVRAASIGFRPLPNGWRENELGGYDYVDVELLEIAIVPIPMNQSALRLDVPEISNVGAGANGEFAQLRHNALSDNEQKPLDFYAKHFLPALYRYISAVKQIYQ